MPVKEYAKSVYWMFGVELDDKLEITAEDMMDRLKKTPHRDQAIFQRAA